MFLNCNRRSEMQCLMVADDFSASSFTCLSHHRPVSQAACIHYLERIQCVWKNIPLRVYSTDRSVTAPFEMRWICLRVVTCTTLYMALYVCSGKQLVAQTYTILIKSQDILQYGAPKFIRNVVHRSMQRFKAYIRTNSSFLNISWWTFAFQVI